MKKYIFAIALLALATPLSVALAHSTITFDRATVNVSSGQTFQVLVSVDPHDEKNYTVKLALDYPADTLQATNFSFSGGWTQLSQPGYDAMDNAKGSLIKTAGYPGGFNTPKTFGTVTFKALKSGSATVRVNSQSLVLDANNANQLSGTPSFSVVVPASAPADATPPAPVVQKPSSPTKDTPSVAQKPSVPDASSLATATDQKPAEAAATEATDISSKSNIASLLESMTLGRVGLILMVLILAVGGIFLLAKRTSGTE